MTALRRSTTHPEPKQKSLSRAHTLALPLHFRELEQRQTSSGAGATKKASSLASAEELRRRQVEAARLPDGGKQLGSAVAAQLAGRVRLTTVSPMQRCGRQSAMFAPHSALSAGPRLSSLLAIHKLVSAHVDCQVGQRLLVPTHVFGDAAAACDRQRKVALSRAPTA